MMNEQTDTDFGANIDSILARFPPEGEIDFIRFVERPWGLMRAGEQILNYILV